jgi:hypothetical protein
MCNIRTKFRAAIDPRPNRMSARDFVTKIPPKAKADSE